MSRVVIGVCGRTGSGKTTAAKYIRKNISTEGPDGIKVAVLSMDDFYRELTEEQHLKALANEHDFDCLASFDLAALNETIQAATRGEPIHFQHYNHATHRKCQTMEVIEGYDVVVFEGLYLFADPNIAKQFDIRIFMEIDPDECLIRRIRRDISKRRRTVEGVLQQYERYVKPAYDKLVAPSKKRAHIIIPGGAHNKTAMTSVYSYIRARLAA